METFGAPTPKVSIIALWEPSGGLPADACQRGRGCDASQPKGALGRVFVRLCGFPRQLSIQCFQHG